MEENIKYYDAYEENLLKELIRTCASLGMMDRDLLASEDIDQKWKEWAADYIAEALPEVNSYPEFAIACAGYAGMAVAKWWDEDWGRHHGEKYEKLHGSRGFDDMDEHIVRDIIGFHLQSREAKAIEDMMRRLGETAVTLIRRERIEPQSPMAFHVYARVVKVMFRIGAAIELKRLGYKFEQVNLPNLGGGIAEC